MTSPPPTDAADHVSLRHQPMPFGEFVMLIACLMALTSLATSMLLAVLVQMGKAFSVDVTATQSVLTTFFVGFSIGQFVVGPIADRFGRRPVLLGGLALYLIASVLCIVAPTLETLLIARFLQGFGAAAPRVVTISVVRDCYSGRRMASVMSLAMTALMVVPVIAPTIGQVVVLAAPWRWIFVFLALYGIVAIAWMSLRLPETLAPENRRSLQPLVILDAVRQALTTPQTLGYMLACGVAQGLLLATLYAAPQVMGELLGMGNYFTIAFGIAAAAMSLAQFANSQLVGRFGLRPLSHGAVIVGTLLSVALLLLARADAVGIISFTAFMCVVNALFMAAASNFNALAMEPQGRIAGTASSLFGSVTTMVQAMIAHGIGKLYDGTMLPLATGMVACGITVIVVSAVTERGRLFGPGAAK
jgi:DHA1 family bicyclomycin/chloramphenicol resistance-like MFS transporter